MSTTKQSQPTAKPAARSDQPPANLFMGTGRLGREPELRYSADGRAWCKTSLAIFQGEDKEPIWLEVKAFARPQDAGGWDERVPLAVAELKKGQKVAVRGKSVLRQARLQRQAVCRLGAGAVYRPDRHRR